MGSWIMADLLETCVVIHGFSTIYVASNRQNCVSLFHNILPN